MGLPDLYSTGEYQSYREVPFTPEDFSVMDYGPYNNDGMTPPNYSAYERYALDWMDPVSMSPGNRNLENLGSTNQAFIVKTEKQNEFYLFENRQQTGWDKYIRDTVCLYGMWTTINKCFTTIRSTTPKIINMSIS